MSSNEILKEKQDRIRHSFETMNRINGMESNALAVKWLDKHNRKFSSFKNGSFLETQEKENLDTRYSKIFNPFSGEELAEVQTGSFEDFPPHRDGKWCLLEAEERSKCLYRIGKNLEENLQLFSEVESLGTGKHFHKTKYVDIPNFIQTFYISSQKALKFRKNSQERTVIGATKHNSPLLSLSWGISSILATGSTVFLIVYLESCLSALLLCEICNASGLPAGALDVYVLDDPTEKICKKRFFPLNKSSVIVYSDADLLGATNSILEILAFNDTRICTSGCKVFYQEAIEEEFLKLLKEHFEKVLIGENFSKTDLSCLITKDQKYELDSILSEESKLKTEVFVPSCSNNVNYSYYKPIVLCNPRSNFKRKYEEVGGPVVIASSFRTVKESVDIFNLENQASDVSIWTEKLSIAHEVACKLKAETVWFNSQNIYDPQVIREPGFAYKFHRELSLNGHYLSCLFNYGFSSPGDKPKYIHQLELDSYGQNICSDKLFELFTGGAQKPSIDRTFMECVGQQGKYYVAGGSNGDVQTAISFALTAQPQWESVAKGKFTQILISIAEKLNKRRLEFVSDLQNFSKQPEEICNEEIEKSLKAIHYCASLSIEDFTSNMLLKESNLQVLNLLAPIGIVGIVCPDESPLFSFISPVLRAITFRNTVVVIPSEKHPVPALKMCQVFKDSGIPSGVINVISGKSDYLAASLVHSEVNAVWFINKEHALYVNERRIFNFNSKDLCNYESDEFFVESTYKKTVYLPFANIFAN